MTQPEVKGEGTPDNPVGGWYGLKKGYRGRFANYVPDSYAEGIMR